MDLLDEIKLPVKQDLIRFNQIFDETLHHSNAMLDSVFSQIKGRRGKLMRPTLLLLVAHEYGVPTEVSYLSAVMLELLHTASLVHDDIVDESDSRRGKPSINSLLGNKVAVLVGDFLLSSSLEKAAQTKNLKIVNHISNLGKTLATGEIIQLTNTQTNEFSIDAYYDIIRLKTASLFAVTAEVGAISVDVSSEIIKQMNEMGDSIGICFQIRDDIFDYYSSVEIGKPTGNDMMEGKLTLPVLYVLNHTDNKQMIELAHRVKSCEACEEEIHTLIEFTKKNGGIEYAEKCMNEYADRALKVISGFKSPQIRESLEKYVEYTIRRNL